MLFRSDGTSTSNRNGLGQNSAATIFVRGAQPTILNNVIRNNKAPAISIDADAMVAVSNGDDGRATGPVDQFEDYTDNDGPLVRLNQLSNNSLNGMVVRAGEVMTESVWDDTDIVHIVNGEIIVKNFHTFGGLRLKSSSVESLVVKLSGQNAGFTADGTLLDIDDRVGGALQIMGTIGHPVYLTALSDDTVGAGYDPVGRPQQDTNNNGPSLGTAGAWRSIKLERFSNDQNVAIVQELEDPDTAKGRVNDTAEVAQPLGNIAPNEKSGDENVRLGFDVRGFISTNDPTDLDRKSTRLNSSHT